MSSLLKRTFSLEQNRKPIEGLGKRKILLSCNSERESSMESVLSNSMQGPTDTESSDSEFEEHDYCLHNKNKSNFSTDCVAAGNIDSKWKDERVSAVKSRRPKCNSKNAVIARNNRLKKKKYIENLETRNAVLEAENKVLQDTLNRKMDEINSLIRETINLRRVIINSTEIGTLLKCVHLNTNLQISSSLLKDVPFYSQDNPNDHSLISDFFTPSSNKKCATEEGNGELSEFNCNSNSSNDIFNKNKLDFGPNKPSLNQTCLELENQVCSRNQSIVTETEPASELIDSDVLTRCETPSKGFDDLSKNVNLFDDMGLCLHIANKKVSLEFCDSCNLNASK